MKNDNNHISISFAIITIGCIISISYLVYEEYYLKGVNDNLMDIPSIVAICISVLSLAGGVWAQFVQFKKDSSRISDVKSDTSEIKPKTMNIDENVKKIKDEVIETLKPATKEIVSSSNGIKVLVDELQFQKRLKSEISTNMASKDRLMSNIENLYVQNANLLIDNKRLQSELYTEIEKNAELSEKVSQLSKIKHKQVDLEL